MNSISTERSNDKDILIYKQNEDQQKKQSKSLFSLCKKGFEFCEAYGSVLGYYGSVLGVLLAALWTPISNDFEGGCKYPYVSEVARSGVGWYCFFLGAILGGVPWILFSFSYFHTFSQYAFMISSHFKRLLFLTMQYITLVFNILSALGMIATAFFDMGHYPLTHEFSVAFFAVPLNLLMINNLVDMIVYAKKTNKWYLSLKVIALIASFGGILAFTLLGRIDHCKSVTLTMEQCFHETAEEVCFSNQDFFTDGYTALRYYPHCKTMHFWRGFVEYIALLGSAQLLLFLYYDRNEMQSILMDTMNSFPTNLYILKETLEQRSLREGEAKWSLREGTEKWLLREGEGKWSLKEGTEKQQSVNEGKEEHLMI